MASVIFDLRRSYCCLGGSLDGLVSHSKASKISSLVQQHIGPARLRVDEIQILCHDDPGDVQAAEEDCRYGRVPEVDLRIVFPDDIVRFLGGRER